MVFFERAEVLKMLLVKTFRHENKIQISSPSEFGGINQIERATFRRSA